MDCRLFRQDFVMFFFFFRFLETLQVIIIILISAFIHFIYSTQTITQVGFLYDIEKEHEDKGGRLALFQADLLADKPFESAAAGCLGFIHVASPVVGGGTSLPEAMPVCACLCLRVSACTGVRWRVAVRKCMGAYICTLHVF